MAGCTALLGRECRHYLSEEALAEVRSAEVKPSVFFGEEWSVGLETAWQASGAERILTMPNYEAWTEKHRRSTTPTALLWVVPELTHRQRP